MDQYQRYNIEELATDEKFRLWVLDPMHDNSKFWNEWLKQNPDKSGLISQARELVLVIQEMYRDDLSEEILHREVLEITKLAELRKSKKVTAWIFQNPLGRVAAILLVIAGLGWSLYWNTEGRLVGTTTESVAIPNQTTLVKTNNTEHEMTVLLSDSSIAILKKGSTLTYPSKFSRDDRKVELSGEAFFDISKDPKKPFLVYTNETVTKVLGTSFRVKAFDKDNTVMVVVKTGKVSVYPKNEYETLSNEYDREVSGVVLSPNQQVVFVRNENRLEKGIVANPAMLHESAIAKELVFDDKPVSEVFHSLESIYGIAIEFDPDVLRDCVISAQFNEENLRQRMNAICQAIGASYEMIDGQIIINSKGCP